MNRLKKAIDVKSVSKEINGAKILDRVSLKVARDERIVICGPSGSGKTTLLRCLNGLEQVNSGSITVLGIRLNDQPETIKNIRLKSGMLFQSFNLFPHLSILQNCTLALTRVKNIDPTKSIEMAEHYLEKVKILDQKDKYPIALSGGQQQRAAIARALCMEPELLLFDEPTSALDPEMVGEVLDVLDDLSKSGMTMVCVTHEMRFAKKFADRIVFIDEGKIVADCESHEFFKMKDNDRIKLFLSQARR